MIVSLYVFFPLLTTGSRLYDHGFIFSSTDLCILAEIGGIGYWAVIYSRKSLIVVHTLPRILRCQHFTVKDSARHIWDIPLSAVDESFVKVGLSSYFEPEKSQVLIEKQKQYALEVIIGPTTWASKAAIIALYIRVFGSVRWLRLTCYGLLIFTFLFYWSNVAIATAFCSPKGGAHWDVTALERCGKSVTAIFSNGVFGVAADIVLFVLPFPVIFNLQVGRKKIGLCFVFLLGILCVRRMPQEVFIADRPKVKSSRASSPSFTDSSFSKEKI